MAFQSINHDTTATPTHQLLAHADDIEKGCSQTSVMEWWRRLRSKSKSPHGRIPSNGQPLIKHVPPRTIHKPVVRRASETWSFNLKDFRPGSYILLDDQSFDTATIDSGSSALDRRSSKLTWLNKHKLFVGCCLPLISVLLETTMLSLLLYVYMSLPRDSRTGLRQRVSPLYSIWPFVSCIASLKLAAYQAFLFLICFFSVLAAGFLFYLNYKVVPGYWFRRAGLLQSLSATALLLWLAFASADNTHHLHLYLVSLRLLLLFGTKTASWFVSRSMRSAYPRLKFDNASSWSLRLKLALMPPAFLLALLANVGVFSCQDPELVRRKGTTCYHLVAIAAISDWVYSIVNIIFLLNASWDLYYDEHYGRVGKGLSTLGDLHLVARRAG